jgi:hypothetical protein
MDAGVFTPDFWFRIDIIETARKGLPRKSLSFRSPVRLWFWRIPEIGGHASFGLGTCPFWPHSQVALP